MGYVMLHWHSCSFWHLRLPFATFLVLVFIKLTAAAWATVTDMHELRMLYHLPSERGISLFLLRQYVTQRHGDNYAGTYIRIVMDRRWEASLPLRLPLHCHSDSELASWQRVFYVILSVVCERSTADLPQLNSLACFWLWYCWRVTVSSWQILNGCCGWALPRSFVVLLFDLWRNANLAGGFAGRCVCCSVSFWSVNRFAIYGPYVSFFT